MRDHLFRRNSLVAVAVVFVATFAVLEAAIWWAAVSGGLDGLMRWTARVASVLVVWVGIPVTLTGNQLLLANHILQIDVDCTGIVIAALYSALVVAYPLSARSRSLALVVGLPVIAIANLLRLLGVAIASEHLSQPAFAFVHDYLFKVAMVLVVVGLWASWLQIARGNATNA